MNRAFQEPPAGATLLKVNPTDDKSASQSAGFSSVLFDGDLRVEVLNGGSLPAGHVQTRSALEFDISTIPAGSTINSAFLDLVETSPVFSGTGTPVLQVRGYSGDGTVVLSDLLGGLLSDVPGTLITGSLTSPFGSIAVSSFVQSLFTAGDDFAGFILRIEGDNDTASDTRTLQFLSSEAADVSDRPLLSVDFTAPDVAAIPEPATLALFVVGLAGLAGVRRRRRLRQEQEAERAGGSWSNLVASLGSHGARPVSRFRVGRPQAVLAGTKPFSR